MFAEDEPPDMPYEDTKFWSAEDDRPDQSYEWPEAVEDESPAEEYNEYEQY